MSDRGNLLGEHGSAEPWPPSGEMWPPAPPSPTGPPSRRPGNGGSTFQPRTGSKFALRRLGRVTQAVIVLVWSILALDIDWSPARVLMVPYLVACGTLIFLAIFILGAAFQFWTADASEVANAFTYGGNTLTQYPLTIYPTEAVKALTFIVPVAFVNWYPSLFILDRPDPLGLPAAMQFAAPLAALVLCLLAALAWRTGVRRYQSTGS